MPSDSWGSITPLPDDPADLVGKKVTVTTSSGGFTGLTPMSPTPPKVTINGIQLGAIIPPEQRTDEIGEKVWEFKLDEYQLNKLYAEHGKPQINKSDTERMVDAMEPMMAVAEQLKDTLQERGWTYEEAERVAGDFLRQSITDGMRGATK